MYFESIANPIINHCISLISSFMIVRGLSLIIGKYPDEGLIYELLIHNEFYQVHRYFFKEGYFYLSLTFILYLSLYIFNKFMIKSIRKELEKYTIEEKEIYQIGGQSDQENSNQTSEYKSKNERMSNSSIFSMKKNEFIKNI